MMSDITVMEKPEYISYDEIHSILERAHSVNRKDGFVMITSNLNGEQIRSRIGEKGKCWVALDGDIPVGTLSMRMVQRNTWYAKGEIPDYMLAGVIPEYQGKHINGILAQQLFAYARQQGYPLIELDTAEDNTHAISVYEHQGFRLVDFLAKKDLDHYSVVMVKWLDDCPYSKNYCRFRYNLRRRMIRLRYKVGRKKRFGI